MNSKSYHNSLALVLCSAAILVLAGCGKSEILDFHNAQVVNGKVYARNANTPFSGTVTNVPNMQVLSAQEGIAKFGRAIGINVLASLGNLQAAPGMLPDGMLLSVLFKTLCDVHVKDGILDGKATCKAPQSENVHVEMGFSAGRLDGTLKLFDPRDSKQLVSEVTFKEGQPDGKQEIYSPNTRKLVHSASWSNGVLHGKEEGFDETTGKRILLATLVDGKYDSTFTRYAPDGERVIRRGTYDKGQPVGVDESFDAQTGKQTGRAEYVNGRLHGVVKQWDASGNLISEKTYDNGVEVAASGGGTSASGSMPVASVDACVDGWTAAYRKEKGEGAMIAADQIEEWQLWCKAGKRSS